jgi:hypothetical protein
MNQSKPRPGKRIQPTIPLDRPEPIRAEIPLSLPEPELQPLRDLARDDDDDWK